MTRFTTALFVASLLLAASCRKVAKPVERWITPEALVAHGFAQSRVVMVNEAHSGNERNVRARVLGKRLLVAAYAAGARYFAMEALNGNTGPTPPGPGAKDRVAGYYIQRHPEMRELVDFALDQGFTLLAYEDARPDRAHGPELSRAEINRREVEQARNLAAHLKRLGPAAKMLVWCGNGHHTERQVGEWTPMGLEFRRLSGIDPFTVDQTAQVFHRDPPTPLVQLLDAAAKAQGGTTAIRRADLPAAVVEKRRYDGFIGSTENGLE